MARPAPVYFLSYNGRNVAVYTQAFRVLACMKFLLKCESFTDKSLFRVVRVGLAPDSEFILRYRDVSSSFIKFV